MLSFQILCSLVAVAFFLLAVAERVCAASTAEDDDEKTVDPAPAPFPSAFSVAFDTNITRTDAYADANDDPRNHPLRGMLYYDWSVRSQRIDHAAGSYECIKFYRTEGPCQLYFLPRGMYRVLEEGSAPDDDGGNDGGAEEFQNAAPSCCLDLPGVGAPPPEWALSPDPTFRGVFPDAYSGIDATFEWAFDNLLPPHALERHYSGVQRLGEEGYHTPRQVAGGGRGAGLPVLFTFPGDDAAGRQDQHYVPSTISVGPQDPSLFRLPYEGCADVLCNENARITSLRDMK